VSVAIEPREQLKNVKSPEWATYKARLLSAGVIAQSEPELAKATHEEHEEVLKFSAPAEKLKNFFVTFRG
jgi:hypothetical protein